GGATGLLFSAMTRHYRNEEVCDETENEG
ncbi:hypothetical protein QIS17_gp1, partial [ssRNA phage SRR7976299_17]